MMAMSEEEAEDKSGDIKHRGLHGGEIVFDEFKEAEEAQAAETIAPAVDFAPFPLLITYMQPTYDDDGNVATEEKRIVRIDVSEDALIWEIIELAMAHYELTDNSRMWRLRMGEKELPHAESLQGVIRSIGISTIEAIMVRVGGIPMRLEPVPRVRLVK